MRNSIKAALGATCIIFILPGSLVSMILFPVIRWWYLGTLVTGAVCFVWYAIYLSIKSDLDAAAWKKVNKL